MSYKSIILLSFSLAVLNIYLIPSAIAFPAPEISQKIEQKYTPILFDSLFGKKNKVKREDPNQVVTHIVDQDSFEKNTKSFHTIPFNDPSLEFDIRLPESWEQMPLGLEETPELSRKLLGSIGHFIGPVAGDVRPYILIQTVILEHEILAHHWLKHYIFSNGYSLQGDVQASDEKNAQASYITLEDNVAFHVKIKAIIRGNQMSIVRFFVPQYIYEDYKGLQKLTVENFIFYTKGKHFIEERSSRTVLDAVKVTYPSSWQIINENLQDPDIIMMQLHNRTSTGNLKGLIQISAFRRKKDLERQETINKIKEGLTNSYGVKFSKILSSDSPQVSVRFNKGLQEIYIINFANKAMESQELRVVLLEDNDWYIIFYLITPLHINDLYNWARNTYSFSSIIKNLQ